MSSATTSASEATPIGRAGRLTLTLFGATIFVAAGLVFLVQPMAAKMFLPRFGGSPAVWAVALVFFQAVLLAGYGFAHLSLRFLTLRAQPLVQLAVLAAPLALLPIAAPPDAGPGGSPTLRLLAVLAVTAGLPFFAVTTASPVLQRWFGASGHGAAGDPYFLYAASNAGSLVGLLAYPLVLEPTLTLEAQSLAWLAGYSLFVMLAAVCALRVLAVAPAGARAVRRPLVPPVAWRKRVRWVALAAIPSSLILGTTGHLSTSIAAVPLLWVIPLAVYLLTFVLAFARRPPLSRQTLVGGVVASTLLVLASLFHVLPLPIAALVAVHAGNLFFVALLVHRRLAAERPAVERLTEFYLLLSLGGVVGGALTALAAPLVFDSIAEYPLALGLGLLAVPGARALRRDLTLAAGFLTGAVVAFVLAAALGGPVIRIAVGATILALLPLARRPLRFAAAVGGLVLLTTFGQQALHVERTFFGVVRVAAGEDGEHVLVHGTTIHGRQHFASAQRAVPLSYYTRQGPLGQVFAARAGELDRVAVVGLGAGSIAAYGRPGDRYTFYEIDPAVARIASDPRWFTFLSDSRADVRIVLGDGRLTIASAPAHAYDLIVLDAFSSDAVPAHLLTREAVELYLAKLSPDGLLAFHITNNHLGLEPVVAGIARSLGLHGAAQHQRVSAAAQQAGANRSHWVVLGRSENAMAALARDARWHRLSTRADLPVWTDQFSNILSVVDWAR